MSLGDYIWIALLVVPIIIGLTYEFYALATGRPVLTHLAREYVQKYPGGMLVLAHFYGAFWGLLLGHLFL